MGYCCKLGYRQRVPGSSDTVVLPLNEGVNVSGAVTVSSVNQSNGNKALAPANNVANSLNITGDYIQQSGYLGVASAGSVNIGGDFIATNSIGGIYCEQGGTVGIQISGDLLAGSGVEFLFRPRSQPSQRYIQVDGVTSLGGATLSFRFLDSPDFGDEILLIRNSSANAVVGSFGNMSFGDSVAVSNKTYTLVLGDYDNDGYLNDVMLQISEPATVSLVVISSIFVVCARRYRLS